MTDEEFTEGYCRRSGITREWYDRYFETLACACDSEGCEGWAAISRSPGTKEAHMQFYAPKPAAEAILSLIGEDDGD